MRSPTDVPWWLAAVFILALVAVHSSAVWRGAGRPWIEQPWWVLWLCEVEGRGATLFAALTTILVPLVCLQTWLERRRAPRAAGRRAWFVVLALFVGVAGARFLSTPQIKSKTWTHAHDTFHYFLGPKYLKEIGYDGLYACAVELAPPRAIPPSAKVRDLATYEMVRPKRVMKERKCAKRTSRRTRARLREDLALWASPNGPGTSTAAYLSFIRDLGYNGTPTHSFFARTVSRSFVLTPQSLARAGLIDVGLLAIMLVFACWVLGAEWGLLFAAFVFTSITDRFTFTGGSFLRYAWLATLVVGAASLRREKGALAGLWLAASTMLNVFPGLFALGALMSVSGETWRRRAPPPFARRLLLGLVLGTALFGGLGMAHSRGAENYAVFATKIERHLAPSKRGKDDVERLPGYGASLKTVIALADVHYLGQPRDKRSITQRFARIKWVYHALAVGLFAWALALAWRLDSLAATALVGFVGAFTTMTLLGYYMACVAVVFLALAASDALRDRMLLIGLCAAHSAAAIRYARTLESFDLYNFSLSHAWLVFIVAWLGTWTVAEIKRSRAAMTGEGTAPRPRV